MTDRPFNKVSVTLWHSNKYTALPDDSMRLHFVYLITNQHVDSTGCYRLPVGYALADRRIDAEEHERCMSGLETAGMIKRAGDYVLIENWFSHNPICNKDHAKGARKRVPKIEDDELRELTVAALDQSENEMLQRQLEKKAAREAKQDGAGGYRPGGFGDLSHLDRFRRVPGGR